MDIKDQTNASDTTLLKTTVMWYLGACLTLFIMMLTEGGLENFTYIVPMLFNDPMLAIFGPVMSCFIVLVFPALHFGIFVFFKTKRNRITFLRILKGWSVTITCFICLGYFAQLIQYPSTILS